VNQGSPLSQLSLSRRCHGAPLKPTPLLLPPPSTPPWTAASDHPPTSLSLPRPPPRCRAPPETASHYHRPSARATIIVPLRWSCTTVESHLPVSPSLPQTPNWVPAVPWCSSSPPHLPTPPAHWNRPNAAAHAPWRSHVPVMGCQPWPGRPNGWARLEQRARNCPSA
jgi:hypothetical protein